MEENKDNKKDCGCGDPNCNCGDDCHCTPEDNCGCHCGEKTDCGCDDPNCNCGDDCQCTPEDNCGCHCGEHTDCGCDDESCTCGDDCDCDGDAHQKHKGHCHCKDKPTDDEIKEMFAQMQYALMQADKELQKAKNDAMDNQRIAVSYKKDLERYKERNANIETDAKNNATEAIAKELVPIVDQFETALSSTKDSAERKGFEMIYSGLKKAVENLGIAEIDAKNKPFDSNYHNAVNRAKVKDKKLDGVVTNVYQKGYYLKNTNKVIRYAMVEIGEYIK